jgi:integrase/recombinase XerD
MTTAAPSAALVTIQPAFTDAERFALAGFLAGYRGLTRDAYALGLRQFASWCRARATVTRRLSTIAGSCKYAVQEELLDRSPAAHVRRSRIDHESHAVALDRSELRACWWPPGSGRRPGTP